MPALSLAGHTRSVYHLIAIKGLRPTRHWHRTIMPLPSDPQLLSLSENIITQFGQLFGDHPGHRAVHARGLMLSGTFTPTPTAASISAAPHFARASTPVTARFSTSTGIPNIPDTDPNTQPRGLAVRFNLAEHVHTDIIGHSTPLFPVSNGQDFYDLFNAIANGKAPEFLAAHPAAAKFVQYPKPFPVSLATEAYYALHAYKFTNAQGAVVFGRYSLVPVAGAHYLGDEEVKTQSESFLWDELPGRIAKAPVEFKVVLQIAEEGDVTDDITVQWPEDRKMIELGIVSLDKMVEENAKEQKKIIYDPVPRVEGIESAGDPLLEVRASVYLMGGRGRRAAPHA
ncbi:Catalase domain-containing protein [Mycena kentingensis (nom. inval.)]|nr:Catalase domain-containing protein [Mycena kentingensis (nom. inval.)]